MKLGSDIIYGLTKGGLLALLFVGAAYYLKQSIGLPIQIFANYTSILAGQYTIPAISDATYYSFNVWAVTMALLFNFMPTKVHDK